MDPNESPGIIHPTALIQLGAWEALANDWPTIITADGYERCRVCTQSILRVTDNAGRFYEYNATERLALIVAHLRQNHNELQEYISEPD